MTPDDIRADGIRGYDLALSAARADYLANRRDGETAAQYDARRRASRHTVAHQMTARGG